MKRQFNQPALALIQDTWLRQISRDSGRYALQLHQQLLPHLNLRLFSLVTAYK